MRDTPTFLLGFASGLACNCTWEKIQLEAARPIFNPTEGKWPVAASFHKRFNELLCPGGENLTVPGPVHVYPALRLPLSRIMGVWGGGD